jgi:steroid delta-isomerase-like uncharacterized protein
MLTSATEENVGFVRQFFELSPEETLARATELVSDDFVLYDPLASEPVRGYDGFIEYYSTNVNAFPDLTFETEDIFGSDDKVVVRYTTRGTHEGDLAGIPPTGREIQIGCMDIYRVEDGKLAEVWACYDSYGMMQQLGLLFPGVLMQAPKLLWRKLKQVI